MKADDILALLKRVDARAQEKSLSSEVYDEQIAQTAETPGWASIVAKAEKDIAELLVPISDEDIVAVGAGGLELIAAMAIARGERIKGIQQVIAMGESTRLAREAMQKQKQKEGEGASE